MPKTFISYRRTDSGAAAGRVFDRLQEAFGKGAVFMDVSGIAYGEDFVEAIRNRVNECEVFLVVIGDEWLETADDEGERRLANPNDFVRLEITMALQREGLRIIPVLVNGAEMPSAEELPEAIRDLARRNAISIRHDRFDADADALIRSLGSRRSGARWVVALAAAVALSIGGYFLLQASRSVAPDFPPEPEEHQEAEGNDEPEPVAEESLAEDGSSTEGVCALAGLRPSDVVPPPTGETRDVLFAGYPTVKMLDAPEGRTVEQLVWGDLVIQTGPSREGWVPVWARYKNGWVPTSEVQEQRLLELSFLTIGSAAGTLVVTPETDVVMVDAADRDGMLRLIEWRFGSTGLSLDAAVITHPDVDRYRGLHPLLENGRVRIDNLYHNGIFERGRASGSSRALGPRTGSGSGSYLTDLVETRDELGQKLVDPEEVDGRRIYTRLLREAYESPMVGDIRSLAAQDQWIPGFEEEQDVSMQVLGPILEPDEDGNGRLRWLGSVSRTKNGHSIVLLLSYGQVRVLFGGDLDERSQDHLLELGDARAFRADVARLRLRTRGNLSRSFLEAVQPAATVLIPSLESAPESVTMIARASRYANSPVIGDTTGLNEDVLDPLFKRYSRLERDAERGGRAVESLSQEARCLQQAVAKYGVTLLRTDGSRVILAEAAQSRAGLWRTYRMEPGVSGELEIR